MEALAEQPQTQHEHIYNPEVRARNDAETWLAEVLDGNMRTPFVYKFDGREFYAEDGGALGPIFDKSLKEVEKLVHKSPKLHFELSRRKEEWGEYLDMLAMARGEKPNTMVVTSEFPEDLRGEAEDVGGYNVTRQQAMLRVITWNGSYLTMYSQSLDRSDRRALEAIHKRLGFNPDEGELLGQRRCLDLAPQQQEFLIDELTGVYDRSLQEELGGEWYAGRESGQRRNTYEFVCDHKNEDLIAMLADEFTYRRYDSPTVYSVAATMKKRFESKWEFAGYESVQHIDSGSYARRLLMEEMMTAAQEAKAEGRTFSGCGASVGTGESTAESQLSEAGYGSQSDSKKEKNTMYCVNCPKCRTFHDKLRAVGGKFTCKKKGCGYTAST